MTLRQHATKAVDYTIGVALFGILAFPIAFSVWWFTGFGPGGEAPDPASERISGIIGTSVMVFLSPGLACTRVLELARIPGGPLFGLVYFVAIVVSVSAFWGSIIYIVVQLFRYLRQRIGLANR